MQADSQRALRVDLLTLFPEVFLPLLQTSMLGRCQFAGSLAIQQLARQRLFAWIHRRACFSPEGSIIKTGQLGQFSRL